MGITLAKGQQISLAKPDGSALARIHVGLGWQSAARGLMGRTKAIDLDASCMVFDASRQLIDQVWFRQLISKDGAIRHTGDDRTGRGSGDNESIEVNLTQLNPSAITLVFVVNSFTGQNFSSIANAFCRQVDMDTNNELARFDLSQSGNFTAQIMAKVSRAGAGWQAAAIGASCSGKTFRDLVPTALAYL